MFEFSSHVNRLIKSENTLIYNCNILVSAFMQLFRPSYGFNLSDDLPQSDSWLEMTYQVQILLMFEGELNASSQLSQGPG